MTSFNFSWFAQPSLSIPVIALCFLELKDVPDYMEGIAKKITILRMIMGGCWQWRSFFLFSTIFLNHSTFLQNILCYSCQFWKPEVVQIFCHQRENSLAPSIVSSFLFEQLSIYIFVDTGSFRHTSSVGRKFFLFMMNVSSKRPFLNWKFLGGDVLLGPWNP